MVGQYMTGQDGDGGAVAAEEFRDFEALRAVAREQRGCIEGEDMEGKGNQLIKAQDIVLELLYALDEKMVQEGDELALNLQRLYLYAYRRLVHANVNLDSEAVEEVIVLMGNLLSAWEEVARNETGGVGSAAPAPSVSVSG